MSLYSIICRFNVCRLFPNAVFVVDRGEILEHPNSQSAGFDCLKLINDKVSWFQQKLRPWLHSTLTPKYLLIHALHHRSNMGFRQMSIAFHNIVRAVAQRFGNFNQGRAVHGQIRGAGMPKVMEAEILESCFLHRSCPGTAKIKGPAAWCCRGAACL